MALICARAHACIPRTRVSFLFYRDAFYPPVKVAAAAAAVRLKLIINELFIEILPGNKEKPVQLEKS